MTALLYHSLFIHVPRTGGMWFRSVARGLGAVALESVEDRLAHCCLKDLPECLRGVPSFAFLRYPLAWACSRWRHSLLIHAREDGRFHGIHADFDRCVRPTLAATLVALGGEDGLVGRTFAAATAGVGRVYRAECVREAAAEVLIDLEGLDPAAVAAAVSAPPINGCTPLPDESVPEEIARRFLDVERDAVRMWARARRGRAVP